MPEEQGSCDRLAQRREVLLAARCRKSSWNVISVELGNISQGGCCIVGDAGEFSVGDSLELRIANLKSIAATVRWICGANAGIEFKSALKARMIEEIANLRDRHQFRSSTRGSGGRLIAGTIARVA